MQALAEAASGPLPPSALLPILCAKETGPAAADLILEVLEKITAEEDNGGGNDHGGSGGIGGNDESKKSVLGKRAEACRRMNAEGVGETGVRLRVRELTAIAAFLSLLPFSLCVRCRKMRFCRHARTQHNHRFEPQNNVRYCCSSFETCRAKT